MAAFFQDLHRTLAAGVALLIVLVILVGLLSGRFIRFDAGCALATVIFGLILAWSKDCLVQALTFQRTAYVIGIGMWLALIMAFNVWFVIWPNQKKLLGIVEASSDEKAGAARRAGMTSRINTMFSIPMLYCMVAQQNAGL